MLQRFLGDEERRLHVDGKAVVEGLLVRLVELAAEAHRGVVHQDVDSGAEPSGLLPAVEVGEERVNAGERSVERPLNWKGLAVVLRYLRHRRVGSVLPPTV